MKNLLIITHHKASRLCKEMELDSRCKYTKQTECIRDDIHYILNNVYEKEHR